MRRLVVVAAAAAGSGRELGDAVAWLGTLPTAGVSRERQPVVLLPARRLEAEGRVSGAGPLAKGVLRRDASGNEAGGDLKTRFD